MRRFFYIFGVELVFLSFVGCNSGSVSDSKNIVAESEDSAPAEQAYSEKTVGSDVTDEQLRERFLKNAEECPKPRYAYVTNGSLVTYYLAQDLLARRLSLCEEVRILCEKSTNNAIKFKQKNFEYVFVNSNERFVEVIPVSYLKSEKPSQSLCIQGPSRSY